jgi:hypothetical protein
VARTSGVVAGTGTFLALCYFAHLTYICFFCMWIMSLSCESFVGPETKKRNKIVLYWKILLGWYWQEWKGVGIADQPFHSKSYLRGTHGTSMSLSTNGTLRFTPASARTLCLIENGIPEADVLAPGVPFLERRTLVWFGSLRCVWVCAQCSPTYLQSCSTWPSILPIPCLRFLHAGATSFSSRRAT